MEDKYNKCSKRYFGGSKRGGDISGEIRRSIFSIVSIMIYGLVFLIVHLNPLLFAQEKDPNSILNNVKERFNVIHDYEVDVIISVDVNFLRVPESRAKVFFKQPDKYKLTSEGFALLPKEGFNFSPANLLKGDFNAIYSRSDTLNHHLVDIIKVIPDNDSSNIILSTLWIDAAQYIVRKIETTTKKSGTFLVEMNYDEYGKFALPSSIKFSFNVSGLQIPPSIAGDMEEEDQPRRRKRDPMVGTVTVIYKNYKMNKGIPDNFFEEEEKL